MKLKRICSIRLMSGNFESQPMIKINRPDLLYDDSGLMACYINLLVHIMIPQQHCSRDVVNFVCGDVHTCWRAVRDCYMEMMHFSVVYKNIAHPNDIAIIGRYPLSIRELRIRKLNIRVA